MKELGCYDYKKELVPEEGNGKIFLAITVHNLDKQKMEEIFGKAELLKEELKKILAS